MSRLTHSLVFLLAFCTAARAQNASTPPLRELWVPAEHLQAVLKQMPRAVMLSADEYRALLKDAAAATRPKAADVPPPVLATIRDAAYEGELGPEVVRMTVTFTVECFTDRWSGVPLTLPQANLSHVEVDERTALRVAPQARGQTAEPMLVVRGKGRHTVVARYHLPVLRSPSGNAIQIPSPGVPAASLRLTLPEGTKLNSALPFTISDAAPNVARFALPGARGEPIVISWTARDIAPIPGAAVFQTCRYLYSIDSSRVQADLGMVLSSSLTDLPNEFTISVPGGARVLSVEGSELLRWSRAGESGDLSVTLLPGKRQAADLRILAETAVPSENKNADTTLALPIAEVRGAHRASGTMALIGSEDVRVKNIATGALTVAAPEAVDPAVRTHPHFVAGFSFPVSTAAPEVVISPVAVRFNAQADTRVELTREAVLLTRNLNLSPLEGRLFSTEIVLPAGEELQAVVATTGDLATFSWQRLRDNRVRLAWQQGLIVSDRAGVTITTRRDPDDWFALGGTAMTLDFPNAALPAAETVTGYVAVAFDESFRVETLQTQGLEPRDGRTTPVSGTLAWFTLSDYALQLSVSRRAAEFEAAIAAYALPLQSTLEVEGQLDLDIKFTPISEIVVALDPAIAAHLRFDSPLIAEKRLDGETGRWTLTFHDELSGARRLRFRLSLPFEKDEAVEKTAQRRFSVSAPVLSLPSAKRVSGHWVIEANTDTELSFDVNGLDAVDSLRVPSVEGYRPRHRTIAAYRYRGNAHTLGIAGTRHAPEELVTTVIDSLRIDTVASTDGSGRHQAVLALRSSGEQFLEIGLPKDATLWTVTVDGAAVKPVRADPGTLRVQLPAREGAETAAVTVKLVYQTPGNKWSGSGSETLQPIRLAARIPTLRSEWWLHLPEGFDYQRFKTNLREEFEVVDRTLLGQVWRERGRFLPDFPKRSFAMAKSAAEPTAGAWFDSAPMAEAAKSAPMAFKPNATPAAVSEGDAAGTPPPMAMTAPAPVGQAAQEMFQIERMKVESLNQVDNSMTTKRFVVPPGFLRVPNTPGGAAPVDPFSAAPDTNGLVQRKTAKDLLESYGIIFPAGSEANYNPQTGELIVRNRADQMELADAVFNSFRGGSDDSLAVVDSETGESLMLQNTRGEATTSLGRDGLIAGDPFAPKATGTGKAANLDLGRIPLASLQIDNLTLGEAINLLETKAREAQPLGQPAGGAGGGGAASAAPIELGLDADADTAGKRVSYSFQNTTLAEVLTRLTQDTGTEYRVTVGGVVIAQPSAIPADQLVTLVLELPNAAFETPDGSGGVRRMSARGVLTSAGIEFPRGTSAAYNFSTRRLAVRHTADRISSIQAHFASYLNTPPPVVAQTEQKFKQTDGGDKAAAGMGLKGFDPRNSGLIPIDFALPESGRSYAFAGFYAPEPIAFRYVNWERQVRFAWLWIAAGGLAFWFGAWHRWRRPVFIGLLGVAVLTFLPMIVSRSLLGFCNSLLIGWLAAAALWVLWRLCERVSRPRRKPFDASAETATATF